MQDRQRQTEIRRLLGLVEDTREIVLPAGTPASALREHDELFTIWSAARAECNLAYDAWCADPGRAAYAAYRAAQDREDAAQDALAASGLRVPSQLAA